MMIDEAFLGRVYKSSFYWSLLILSYMMMSKLISASVGFALGVAVALGVLHTIERVVKVIVVPGGQMNAKTKMGAFGVAKYFILAIVVGVIVNTGWISLPAFACGIAVPTAIIFLKVLAHTFHEHGILDFHPFWGHHNHIDPQMAKARRLATQEAK